MGHERSGAEHLADSPPGRPAVSVILPVRNMQATIGGQLAALARQGFAGSWELVVADNCSSDGTSRSCSDGRIVFPYGLSGRPYARIRATPGTLLSPLRMANCWFSATPMTRFGRIGFG